MGRADNDLALAMGEEVLLPRLRAMAVLCVTLQQWRRSLLIVNYARLHASDLLDDSVVALHALVRVLAHVAHELVFFTRVAVVVHIAIVKFEASDVVVDDVVDEALLWLEVIDQDLASVVFESASFEFDCPLTILL